MTGLFIGEPKKAQGQERIDESIPIYWKIILIEFYFQSSLFFGTMVDVITNNNFNYRGKYANR